MDIEEFYARRGSLRALGMAVPPSLGKIRVNDGAKRPSSVATLYHYTSISAFRSIINSKKMWATSALKMNDKEEIYYAINLMMDIVQRSDILEDDDKKFLNEFIPELLVPRLQDDIFIICFTFKNNVLSQWRGYSGNDGLNFGVPVEILEGVAKQLNGTLRPVIYNPNLQVQFLLPALNVLILEYFRHGKEIVNSLESMRKFTDSFRDRCVFVKHPTFHEEAEARLAIRYENIHPFNVSHRHRRGKFIPYIEIPIFEDYQSFFWTPFTQLLIGPCVEPCKNIELLSEMLDRAGLDWNVMSFCGVPLDVEI